jgi:hypothetical protein
VDLLAHLLQQLQEDEAAAGPFIKVAAEPGCGAAAAGAHQ